MPAESVADLPAETALRSCVQMRWFDPHTMRMALQDGVIEHVQLGGGVFEGTVVHAATDRLRTDWGSYNLPVQGRGDLSRDMLTVGVLIGGHGEWRLQGAPAASGDIVLLGEGGELLINLPAQAQWLALQVPRERLLNAGVPLGKLRGATAWRIAAMHSDASCNELAVQLPALAPHAAASARADAEVLDAQEQLLTSLLCEWERRRVVHAGLKPERLLPGERWRVLRRVEAYIEDQPGVTWRIDDLCTAAHTSLSTLERAFREVFGLSPRRYLALRRLAGVRDDLLNGDPGQSITDVATRWGFYNHGRFAQEYSQLYQERPSQTRSRVRG